MTLPIHEKFGQNVCMRKIINWKMFILLLIVVGAWLIYFLNKPVADWHSGKLVIILPADKSDIASAFELELAKLFAQQLNLELQPIYLPAHKVSGTLNAHHAHLAASGLRRNASDQLRYSETYQMLDELIVCQDKPIHRNEELLNRSITLVTGSAQEVALKLLKYRLPELKWESQTALSQNELLHQVADGKLDCTAANEEQLATARNFHPELGRGFDLQLPSHLAWGFPLNTDDELFELSQTFFKKIKKDGTLIRLIDQYYGHNERLEAIDTSTFITQTKTVLPHYRALFEEAERLTGIEWQLLAALAYQESHWNPLATSFTNVRGMMMLTEDTADRMNVDNRLDARSSILAGARYLQLLKDDLPPRIKESERIWMALAAYNQGMGHLEDARVLAAKTGLDPNSWMDMKKVLPLLARPEFAAETKHGSARGGEAVILVETVHLYRDMLKRVAPASLADTSMFGLANQPSASQPKTGLKLKAH